VTAEREHAEAQRLEALLAAVWAETREADVEVVENGDRLVGRDEDDQ
jgi:hypothetical protein